MPDYRYSLVDVFAERPLEGNLLAVIEDADGIDAETMQTLARRFRLSETSFIQSPTSATATYRHRIFIVTDEIPFAGHPSLGTAAVWAWRKGKADADLVQETISGEQRIKVQMDGRSGTATIWQNPAEFGEIVEAGPILAALGLPADAAHPSLPAQLVSTGLPTTIVPLRDPALLGQIAMSPAALEPAMTASDGSRTVTCYVVAETGPGEWRARSFGTDLAGGEDPATGSAAGPFGAYLNANTGATQVTITQGVEMECPSVLRVDTRDGVVVSGNVQIVGDGVLTLP
jgi:trans-2,3-dihydro-3-hydroxyanthranilate isomerase